MKFSFNPADVFGPQDAYEGSPVMAYVGKQGYFGDNLEKLQKSVTEHDLRTLEKIAEREVYPYQLGTYANQRFTLFLPADKVVQPKPKKVFRPIKNAYELLTLARGEYVGDLGRAPYVRLRCKIDTTREFVKCITEVSIYNNNFELIGLGACTYSPKELLNDYEIYNQNTEQWVPVGVLEERDDE